MTPLRIARKRRGWTLEEAANELRQLGAAHGYGELGVDANAISRWERGKHVPREPYPELCAELFATTVEALWPGIMGDVERRDFLGLVAAAPVAAVLPRSGPVDVEAITAVTGSYRSLEATTPATDLLGPVRAHLSFVARRANSPRLHAAASEVAGFTAWLAFDQGDHQEAQRRYRQAIGHARASGQAELVMYMLGSAALWAADAGRGNEAVRFARSLAPTTANPTVVAWTHAARATALAAIHRADAALGELSKAKPGGDPSWPFLTPFDDVKLARNVGHVAMMVGQPHTAIGALRNALDSAPTKARARTLADLATCYRQLGQYEEANEVQLEALAIAATTGTRRL